MKRDASLPLTETVYYILLALTEPLHGYVIMQKVEKLSEGQVRMAAGTLYGAIENLLRQKLIQPVISKDSRRKVYTVTEKGRRALYEDCLRMKHMIKVTENMLEPGEHK